MRRLAVAVPSCGSRGQGEHIPQETLAAPKGYMGRGKGCSIICSWQLTVAIPASWQLCQALHVGRAQGQGMVLLLSHN